MFCYGIVAFVYIKKHPYEIIHYTNKGNTEFKQTHIDMDMEVDLDPNNNNT